MLTALVEQLSPALALGFTAGTLDSRVTFARAGATATRVNSSGYIEPVAADTPRFDYDPVTLACKGLLIEEQRTNLIYPSANMAAANWILNITGAATVNRTANAAFAPDGTNAATLLALTAAPGEQAGIYTTFSSALGLDYTGSFYIKANSAGDVGKTIGVRHAGSATYTLVTLPADWQRVSIVENSVATAVLSFDLILRPAVGTSSGTVSFLMWGAQIEQGAFVTSYIPTTSATSTRNADVATIVGTNFSDFWRPTRGGALARAQQRLVNGVRPWLQFDDGTANNVIALRGNTTNPELYIKATTDQVEIDAGTIAADTSYRLAGAWSTDSCAANLNGSTALLDGAATIPTVNQARLGSDGTNYLNGWLESIEYYDTRPTNAGLQVLSSAAGYRSMIRSMINPIL